MLIDLFGKSVVLTDWMIIQIVSQKTKQNKQKKHLGSLFGVWLAALSVANGPNSPWCVFSEALHSVHSFIQQWPEDNLGVECCVWELFYQGLFEQ